MVPKYSINLLNSLAQWLETRSLVVWAREFGHSGLMQGYAKDLHKIVDALKADHPQCSHCKGILNAPLGREPSQLECKCVETELGAVIEVTKDRNGRTIGRHLVWPKPEPTIGGCGACGIQGIHACLGRPVPQWTPEKIEELQRVMKEYAPKGQILPATGLTLGTGLTSESATVELSPETKAKVQAFDKIANLLAIENYDGVLARLREIVKEAQGEHRP